jgi:predicted nucleotidyltransferase
LLIAAVDAEAQVKGCSTSQMVRKLLQFALHVRYRERQMDVWQMRKRSLVEELRLPHLALENRWMYYGTVTSADRLRPA